MVQIIQQQPSLAELLGAGMGAGISTGIQNKLDLMLKEKANQQQMERLGQMLGFDQPEELVETTDIAEGEEAPKKTALEQRETQLEKLATNPMAMMELAQSNPQVANQIQSMYTNLLNRRKEERKVGFVTPETQTRMTDVLSRQLDLLKDKNIGFAMTPKLLTEKGREDRAEFDTLGASVEAALLPLLNKGVLSKSRFDYILGNIPRSSDTIGKIKGKIKALEREFDIKLPGLKEKDAAETTKVTDKELTKDMAQKFLKAAKGDKEKAREVARKAGYNF